MADPNKPAALDPRWPAIVADYRAAYEAWLQSGEQAGSTTEAANRAYYGALDTLAAHRVTNLIDLAEKIAIVDADYTDGDVPHERVADMLADVRCLAAADLKGAGAASPLSALLYQRNALVDGINGEATDAETDLAAGKVNRLDSLILDTPATGSADVFAKVLLIAQLASEGHSVQDGIATSIVQEARRWAPFAFSAGSGASPISEPEPAMAESCFGCRFWLVDERTICGPLPFKGNDIAFGRCRRNAPRVTGDLAALGVPRTTWGRDPDPDEELATTQLYRASPQPVTAADDWCGDFSPIGGR